MKTRLKQQKVRTKAKDVTEILDHLRKNDLRYITFSYMQFCEIYQHKNESVSTMSLRVEKSLKDVGLLVSFGHAAICVCLDANFAPMKFTSPEAELDC